MRQVANKTLEVSRVQLFIYLYLADRRYLLVLLLITFTHRALTQSPDTKFPAFNIFLTNCPRQLDLAPDK